MRKYLVFSLLGLLGLLSYFLFENIFTWNFWWEPLPESLYTEKEVHVIDSSYALTINRASKELQRVHKESKAPAISIAVSIDRKIIWTQAQGFMDVKARKPATSETMFRIGSTSKALTSIVLGKLIQDQKVRLDQDVQDFVSGFEDKKRISIKQLASHTSGIRNYGVCFCFPIWEYYSKKAYTSVESSLEIFKNDELLFEPGANFSYSTYNYTILSAVMEQASGLNFLELTDQTFSALEMHRTMADQSDLVIEKRSEFYDVSENQYKEAFEVDLSNKWAGGGFLSTPSDLVRAGNVLLSDNYLNSEIIELITTPQKLDNEKENTQGYALGWRNYKTRNILDNKEVRIIHHGGVSVGSQSLLVVFPEYRMVISLLLNKSRGSEKFQLFNYLNPIAEIFISDIELK